MLIKNKWRKYQGKFYFQRKSNKNFTSWIIKYKQVAVLVFIFEVYLIFKQCFSHNPRRKTLNIKYQRFSWKTTN